MSLFFSGGPNLGPPVLRGENKMVPTFFSFLSILRELKGSDLIVVHGHAAK